MRRLIAFALFLPLVGCGGSKPGLRLTLLEASVRRPSNIAVYFTVETAEGEPVPGLTAEAFHIYEDDRPVSQLESQQTILNAEVAATHYTILLVDMSRSVSESGDVPVIVEAARAFTERIGKLQKVSIYAFDGSAGIHAIGDAERLASFQPRDPSTNLNGAVLESIKILRRQMSGASTPLSFGTLVVFTDGSDRAHRVSREQLQDELAQSEIGVIMVGVGAEIDPGELGAIGRSGVILNKDRAAIASSFEAAAARVEAFAKRYYLLGYCSPARAGEHQVTIEATVGEKRGSLPYLFDARGFGPNCDPTQKPSFNLKRPRRAVEAEPPPPPDTGGHTF